METREELAKRTERDPESAEQPDEDLDERTVMAQVPPLVLVQVWAPAALTEMVVRQALAAFPGQYAAVSEPEPAQEGSVVRRVTVTPTVWPGEPQEVLERVRTVRPVPPEV